MTAVALRYMAGFRCIGPACEDHCCGSWGVIVDQGHHAKIRRALSASPEGKKDADRLFTLRPPGQRSAAQFASIEMTADGACPLLDPDRLCVLQRRHGEDLLPDTCAMYPRLVSKLGPRLELSGSLSCPEVARRALLPEDATDTVPAAQADLGRAIIQKDAASLPLSLSGKALDLWRSTLFSLLAHHGPGGPGGEEAHPLASQLFFCAFLAQRVDGQGEAEEAELDRLCAPGSLAALHDRFTEIRAGIPAALHVVLAVLGRRLRPARTSAFHRVVGEVMRSYAAEEGAGVRLLAVAGGTEESELEIDRDALLCAYGRRREAAEAALGPLLPRALRNYGRNYFVREWPVRGEPSGADLFAHVQGLLLRLALLRFLSLSHPAAQGADHAADRGAALLVEVTYAFSRIVEHHDAFGAGVQRMLRERMGELGHAISLINV